MSRKPNAMQRWGFAVVSIAIVAGSIISVYGEYLFRISSTAAFLVGLLILVVGFALPIAAMVRSNTAAQEGPTEC